MVDTGWVSDPDIEPVALRPATGMLTVNARALLAVLSSPWSEDEQLMSTRQQPSARQPRLCKSHRDEARCPCMPILPRAIRKAIDHPGQADAVRALGRSAASVALAPDAGLLMSSDTSSCVTVCGDRSSGALNSRVRVSGSPWI
jgi:hypothetical protein